MPTDAELLDYLFLVRKLARASCPLCRLIVPNLLASQDTFSHRLDPLQYHRCTAQVR